MHYMRTPTILYAVMCAAHTFVAINNKILPCEKQHVCVPRTCTPVCCSLRCCDSKCFHDHRAVLKCNGVKRTGGTKPMKENKSIRKWKKEDNKTYVFTLQKRHLRCSLYFISLSACVSVCV